MKVLNFIYDYLRNLKQRTKIDNAYSPWRNILYGVPQGSILGSLLFNIDLCDLFLIMNHEDIANYADDNRPYVSGFLDFWKNLHVLSSNDLVTIIFKQMSANALCY